ncbi:MAG: hypothetical protein R3F20_03610 [Planctomycetota bacterium]
MMLRALHLVLCLAAASLPWWTTTPAPASAEAANFPGWPESFEGAPLDEEPVEEIARRFESGYPGRIGLFQQGGRRVVLHWIAAPTRAFHFSGRCLEGRGWSLDPRPRITTPAGVTWARYEATRGQETVRLRQRIVDDEGRAWYDESAWYWATLRGGTKGPWTAWTVVEPLAPDDEAR